MITMTVQGGPEAVADMERILGDLLPSTMQAATEYAEGIMGESMLEVPVDTGALRRSSFVNEAEVIDATVQVLMGYDMQYAVYVHEDLNASHPRGGKAKYLEDPVNRYAPGFPAFLADRLSIAMQGAV